MKPSLSSRLVLGCAILLGTLGSALAQSASCERYRAELASLNRAGTAARSAEANAQRYQAEINRLTGYYRSIGCEQGGFFFQPAAECAPIAQRIRALQSSYGAVASQGDTDPAAIEARRRQVRAAIAKACEAASETDVTTADAKSRSEPSPVAATGGERLVCVRTCDGFFFPVENTPTGSANTASLCRALCPNAEVAVYKAPRDGGIETAVSESGGKPYMQLANALKYQKAYDPSCSCKKQGESWAQALQKAERMIASNKNDVVVTQAVADRMVQTAVGSAKSANLTRRSASPATAAAKAAVPDVETTGSVSGAKPAEGENTTPRKPRIIAPDVIPVPQAPSP
jgi:hypothetical protein